MTNEDIHSTIFKQRWHKLIIHMSNGEALATTHPDYLFMPPEKNWVLHVNPQGKGLQIIPTAHIASLELEMEPVKS